MADPTPLYIQGLPKYATISKTCELIGVARTKLYALIGDRSVRAVKCGGRTLCDMEQVLGWMATLPAANINPQVRRAVAA
jgi:excisionase family DNA binding protein